MPHQQYLQLLALVKNSDLFQRWKPGNKDAMETESNPIELLVLT